MLFLEIIKYIDKRRGPPGHFPRDSIPFPYVEQIWRWWQALSGVIVFMMVIFETQSYYIAWGDLEFEVFLLLSSKYYKFTCVSPHPAMVIKTTSLDWRHSCLRVLAAFPEDLGSILSTLMWIMLVTPAPKKIQHPLLASMDTRHMYGIDIYTQAEHSCT